MHPKNPRIADRNPDQGTLMTGRPRSTKARRILRFLLLMALVDGLVVLALLKRTEDTIPESWLQVACPVARDLGAALVALGLCAILDWVQDAGR